MAFHTEVLESTLLWERGLAAAFECSADALLVADGRGIVRFCNAAIETMTGCSKQDILGKRLHILGGKPESSVNISDTEIPWCTPAPLHLPPGDDWFRQLWQTLLNRRTWSSEFVSRRKDGTTYSVAVRITTITDSDGAIGGMVACYRDITVERRLQAELSRSRGLEAAGRMAVGIAHDFSNVLSVVNGCSDWLMTRMNAEHPLYDRTHQIRQAGQRGAELTHQLLALSRVKGEASREVDVNEQIRRASSTLQHLAGVDIQFCLKLNPEAGLVRLDAGQFLQALLNLVANARDAMPTGGTLTIVTGRKTRAAQSTSGEVIHWGPVQPGPYLTVAVSDSGTGMGELTKSRAFDTFFTTKDFGQGTGLGLAFVADLVRGTGGFITVDTEIGQGTTFCLHFPEAVARVVSERLELKSSRV